VGDREYRWMLVDQLTALNRTRRGVHGPGTLDAKVVEWSNWPPVRFRARQ